jgi:WD40 repeat protein
LAWSVAKSRVAVLDFPGPRPTALFDNPVPEVVTDLALSAGGRYLATQSIRKHLALWDTANPRPLMTMSSPDERLGRVLFSPDERYLACVDDNTRLLLYDLPALRAEWRRLGVDGPER